MLRADVEVDRRDFTVRAAIEVAPGERLALFGPSGAGKTTLLEAIAGLVGPKTGSIELAGRILTRTSKPRVAVPPWQRRVGLLRQDPGLFPHMSVRDNLAYARSSRGGARGSAASSASTTDTGASGGDGRGRQSDRPRRQSDRPRQQSDRPGWQFDGTAGQSEGAGWQSDGPGRQSGGPGQSGRAVSGELAELADALGIGNLLSAMPARLSGGQQHRAALARLLLAHCDALLLDEPYSGLDAALRRTLTSLVVRLVIERGVPAILVAHELADAQAFATRMAVMDRGELLQLGTPDLVVLRPASVRVAELVGYLGFAPVTDQPGVVAGIHPDRVLPGRAPARGLVLDGTVAASRPAGASWEVDLLVRGASQDDSVVTCRLPDRPGPDHSALAVTALSPPLFGPEGMALAASAGPSVIGGVVSQGGRVTAGPVAADGAPGGATAERGVEAGGAVPRSAAADGSLP